MKEIAMDMAMVISVVMMCMLLGYALLYREERGVRYFAWTMVCRVVYAVSVILELNSVSLSSKLLFRHMEQTALAFIVPFMALCVLDLFGREEWLKLRRKSLIFSIFAGWALLIWTDPYTGLINRSIMLVDGQLELTKSPLSIGFNLFCYIVLGICVFFFVLYLRNAQSDIRKSWIWVIVFGCMTFIMEIVKLANPKLMGWLLPLTVFCGVFGLLMLWIIARNKLFSIVPMARNVIVETMQEGILIANDKGKIIEGNSFLNPLFGYQEDGMAAGRDVGELLKPWPQWLEACQRMEEGSFEINGIYHEETRVFMVKVYTLGTKRGRRLGSVSVLFDITEKQLRLEQMLQLNRMKDQLFTVVSHDIRDPLAVQVNLIELLEADKAAFSDEHYETIQMLSGQIRNTYVLVLNVLEWFRGQKEGVVLRPESQDLADLIWEAYRMLLIRSEAKFVNLNIDVQAGTRVYADREATIMIIRNLLSNAIKFSERGGLIHVTAEASCNRMIIAISDHGVGMSEEQMKDLFNDSRFNSSIGTEGERGTGLGLHVSRQFVRMSGGELWVESKLHEGSTFYFSLMVG
jgi:PAS domain S-box-containing protein